MPVTCNLLPTLLPKLFIACDCNIVVLLMRTACMSADKQKKESAKRGRPSEDEPSDSKASKKQKKQDEKGKAKKLSKEELAKQRQKDNLLEVSPPF